MTREEQIFDIASQYAINETDGQNNGKAASKRGLMLCAFRDGAQWADQHPQWISVEERLPKHNVEENGLISYPCVLVCLYDGCRAESYYDDIRGEWGDYDGEVEYWMPMPEAPRKEGNQ